MIPEPVPDSLVDVTEIVTTEGEAFAAMADTAVAVEGLLITTPWLPLLTELTVVCGLTAIAMPAPIPPPIRAPTTAAAATGIRMLRRSPRRNAEPSDPALSGSAETASRL